MAVFCPLINIATRTGDIVLGVAGVSGKIVCESVTTAYPFTIC